MKLTCFIISTLLIVFITQQSTNGLPIDDVTTQLSCTEGFEILNGECQPISSSSQKPDTKFNRSKFEETTLSYEGTTEENKKLGKSEPCPEGKIRSKNGDCKNIILEDQPSTTTESKKLDKTSEEHDNESLDHTTEPVEHERKPKVHNDEPKEHEKELLDHTTEPVEHERKPKAHEDEPAEHEKELLDHTTEPVEHEREPKVPKAEPIEDEKESSDRTNKLVEPKRKPKILKDEPKEDEKESSDRTNKPVEPKRKPKILKDEPKEDEKEPSDRTNKPVVDEKESSGSNGEKSDTPKGCPPGTKVDEEGACQDEVEHTSTTLTMNLKDLLPKDGSCPAGMELFKNKCIYIKSKDNSTVDGLMETEKPIADKDNTENKLVPVLKGDVCPPDTEYYSNGLCRVRTRTSPVKVISVKETCPLGEILIDGKCQQKFIEQSKTIKVPLEIKVPLKIKASTQNEETLEESS